jgi:WD40 repeat protein
LKDQELEDEGTFETRHSGEITRLIVLEEEKVYITGSYDGCIMFWNLKGDCLKVCCDTAEYEDDDVEEDHE